MISKGKLQAVAEDKVREYFEAYPREVFDGSITVHDIVLAIGLSLPPDIFGAIKANGMIYDAIRLLGPCGEHDDDWLHRWGGRDGWAQYESEWLNVWAPRTARYMGGRMI